VELFRRMVFNAMVTNNDDHPRNHALLQVDGGWRLSPAYDIVPVPATSKERRDLALDVGTFGRAASIYNLLSQPEVFGLSLNAARAEIDRMRQKVSGWQGLFNHHGVSATDIEKIAPAMLPESFERTAPSDPVWQATRTTARSSSAFFLAPGPPPEPARTAHPPGTFPFPSIVSSRLLNRQRPSSLRQ